MARRGKAAEVAIEEAVIEPARIPIYQVRPVTHTPELHIADYALAATPTKPLDFNTLSHLCMASGSHDVDEIGAVSNFIRHMLMDDRSIGVVHTLEKTFLDIIRNEEEIDPNRLAALEHDARADMHGWQMLLKPDAVPFLDSSGYYRTVASSSESGLLSATHERVHIPKFPNVINKRADKWYKIMSEEPRHSTFIALGRSIKSRTDGPNLTTHRYNTALNSTALPDTHATRAHGRKALALNNPPASVAPTYLADVGTEKQRLALDEISVQRDPDELDELTEELPQAKARETALQAKEATTVANLRKDLGDPTKGIEKKGLDNYTRQLNVNKEIRASNLRQLETLIEIDKAASADVEKTRKNVIGEEESRKKAAIAEMQKPPPPEKGMIRKGMDYAKSFVTTVAESDDRPSLVVQLRRKETDKSTSTSLFGFVAFIPAAHALLTIGNGIAGYRQSSTNPASGVASAVDVEAADLARIATEHKHTAVINAFKEKDGKPLTVSLDDFFQADDRRKDETQVQWANTINHMKRLEPNVLRQSWVALTCYVVEPKTNLVILNNYYRLLATRFILEHLKDVDKLKEQGKARVYFFPESIRLSQAIEEQTVKHWFKYTLTEEFDAKDPLKRRWLPTGIKRDIVLKDKVFHPRIMLPNAPNSVTLEEIPPNIDVLQLGMGAKNELRINISTGLPIVETFGKLTELEGTLDDALKAFFVSADNK